MSFDAAPADTALNPKDLTELAEIVGRTSFGVVGIAGALEDVESGAKRQLDILETVTRAATEANLANERVQDAIQAVVDRSAGTLETVSSSVADMRSGAQNAQDLAAWVSSVHNQVIQLGLTLQSVQADNDKIASIAANVNILAINAGIEAARAGDAGRGFAVVADAINDLSKKTRTAAGDISENVSELSVKVSSLQTQAEQMSDRAKVLENNASATDTALTQIADRVIDTQSDANHISREAASVKDANAQLLPKFADLAGTARQTSQQVESTSKNAQGLIDDCESMVQICARVSSGSPDQTAIRSAQAKAKQISEAFEDALARNRITLSQLFSKQYTPIEKTNPQQLMAPFTILTDRLLPRLLDAALEEDPRIVFCAAVDSQGYLPTHNTKFSQKQGRDPDWNAANCRNRRLFNDRVGLKAGQNTDPILVQVYRRDMGGGTFRMMKDISAPIYVNGRHWGGLRVGYSV